MSEKNSNLKHELIKTVVDKFLIGVILLVSGIYATNLVERLKSERSFSAELSKTRVEKIAEVWEKVYLYEADTKSSEEILKAAINKVLSKEGEKKSSVNPDAGAMLEQEVFEGLEANRAKYEELLVILNKNRFWIGEESYSKIREYIEASKEYLQSLRKLDQGKQNQLAARRDKLRENIIQVRDRLLKE